MTAATADRAYLVAGRSRSRPQLQPLTAPTAPVEAGVSAHGVDLDGGNGGDRAYQVAGHSVEAGHVRGCNLSQRLQHRSQRPRPQLQPPTAPTAPVEAGVSAHGVDLVTAATADRAYLVAGHSVPVRSCNLPQRLQHRSQRPRPRLQPLTAPTAPVTASKPVSAPTESTW